MICAGERLIVDADSHLIELDDFPARATRRRWMPSTMDGGMAELMGISI
jgi:hypothetical protein